MISSIRKLLGRRVHTWDPAFIALSFLSIVESAPVGKDIVLHRSIVECVTATWQRIFLFMLLNYATHIVTVTDVPGESSSISAARKLAALLLPYSGIMKGFRAICTAREYREDDLQHAARAGALCVVSRSTTWIPVSEEENMIENDRHPSNLQIDGDDDVRLTKRVHGRCILPDGYYLRHLPSNVSVSWTGNEGIETQHQFQDSISSSWNIAAAVVALVQIGFAISTMWRARGTQLELYGYAAFSFTVIPYAIMSTINLIGNIATPSYQYLYIVGSSVLDEALQRPGAAIDGTVGRIVVPTSMASGHMLRHNREWKAWNARGFRNSSAMPMNSFMKLGHIS